MVKDVNENIIRVSGHIGEGSFEFIPMPYMRYYNYAGNPNNKFYLGYNASAGSENSPYESVKTQYQFAENLKNYIINHTK